MTIEEQLRDRITELLLGTDSGSSSTDYPTDAGANVFPMRWKPIGPNQVPAIAIFSAETPSENMQTEGAERRVAMIDIQLYVSGPQTPDTPEESADKKLDTLRAQVETILGKRFDDLGVDGIAEKEYQGFKLREFSEKESTTLILLCLMRYAFLYYNDLPPL